MNPIPHPERPAFSALVGRTLVAIVGGVGDDTVNFKVDDGAVYQLHHEPDCCEHVRLEDCDGDLVDLIGSPITMADEVSSLDWPDPDSEESWTWTFYKISTVKGYVTLRWLGESNGYYSESVEFRRSEPWRSPTRDELDDLDVAADLADHEGRAGDAMCFRTFRDRASD